MERRIVLILILLFITFSATFSQQDTIKTEIDSALAGPIGRKVDISILKKDMDYSFHYLEEHIDDTCRFCKRKVYYGTAKLFREVPKSKKDLRKEFISLLIEMTKDKNFHNPEYFSSVLYNYTYPDEFDSVHIQVMDDTLFYRDNSSGLPLLIAELNLKEYIPYLKHWANTTNLTWLPERNYKAALGRLGDEEMLKQLIQQKFDLTQEENHIDLINHTKVLNYIRRKETTEKLFQYLYDKRKIIMGEWVGGGTIKEYSKVCGLAIYHLQEVVKDFPIRIDYNDLTIETDEEKLEEKKAEFDKKVKEAREWYEQHKNNYQINRSLDNFNQFR